MARKIIPDDVDTQVIGNSFQIFDKKSSSTLPIIAVNMKWLGNKLVSNERLNESEKVAAGMAMLHLAATSK